MAYRWACPHCEFVVWAPSRDAVARACKAHLPDHFDGVFTKTVFHTEWSCPMCDETASKLEQEAAVDSFREHLVGHESARIIGDIAPFDDIGPGTGILFLTPDDRRGIASVRSRLLCAGDTVVTVTRDLAGWSTLVEEDSAQLPDRIVLLTPDPDAVTEMLRTDHRVETVDLTDSLSVGGIGKAVSVAVEEHSDTDNQLTVEFDMMSAVIDACDPDATFRFLHLFEGVLDKADATWVVPFNPSWVPDPTLNVFTNLFDLVMHGDRSSLRRFIMPAPAETPSSDRDATFSRFEPTNQRIVPTGPSRYRRG